MGIKRFLDHHIVIKPRDGNRREFLVACAAHPENCGMAIKRAITVNEFDLSNGSGGVGNPQIDREYLPGIGAHGVELACRQVEPTVRCPDCVCAPRPVIHPNGVGLLRAVLLVNDCMKINFTPCGARRDGEAGVIRRRSENQHSILLASARGEQKSICARVILKNVEAIWVSLTLEWDSGWRQPGLWRTGIEASFIPDIFDFPIARPGVHRRGHWIVGDLRKATNDAENQHEESEESPHRYDLR